MNIVLDGGTVLLVDTIIEAHRTGTWPALSGGYRIETVEECVTETQTGFQRRRREETIVAKELRASMASVHSVGDRERAELAVRVPDIWLDEGEARLWAHALKRDAAWLLCGPDKASLRCGVRLRFRDRLVSLEGLVERIGRRPKPGLREQYTRKWLDQALSELVLLEMRSFLGFT